MTIQIGKHTLDGRFRHGTVGPGHATYVVVELGINHNGSVETAKRMIDVAAQCGAQAVKLQKRTVDAIYTPEELAVPLAPGAPNGWKTRGDYCHGRELSLEQHWELAAYAANVGLDYSASAFDMEAFADVELCAPAFHKVASAMLTHLPLLRAIRSTGRPVLLSTGMSTLEQIDTAVAELRGSPLVLLHCVSAYPCPAPDLNLRVIETLRRRYDLPVGYSGHETGIAATLCAVVLGACVVERHLTLDRSSWGSDHSASLEPDGLRRLVRDIRMYEAARGDGVKRVIESELPVMARLRKVG